MFPVVVGNRYKARVKRSVFGKATVEVVRVIREERRFKHCWFTTRWCTQYLVELASGATTWVTHATFVG